MPTSWPGSSRENKSLDRVDFESRAAVQTRFRQVLREFGEIWFFAAHDRLGQSETAESQCGYLFPEKGKPRGGRPGTRRTLLGWGS